MDVISDTIRAFFGSVRYCINDIIIFPGKNLRPALKYAIGISVISIICYIFKLPIFINPIGATIGTLFLVVLVLLNKGGEIDEPVRTDESSSVLSSEAESGIESASESIDSEGSN